jgi:hypothetical protein
MEINRYHVFVSTALRSNTSQSSSNFSVAVNPPLIKQHPNHYFTAQIVSVEIPYTWNQVNSTNNVLQIVYQSITYTINITPGNYTIYNLITELANKVNSVIPAHPWTDSTTYNSTTGVITFGIKDVPSMSTNTYVVAYNFPANQFLARMFGCLNNSSIVFGYGPISSVYQYINVNGSTNINVNPVSSIYLRSSNLKQILNQENLVSGYAHDPSDILCKLQVYTPPKTWIFYNGELGLSARISNPIIDQIAIYLSDNSSFDLNLNQNDWTFRITFVEYRPFDLTDSFLRTKDLNGLMNQEHTYALRDFSGGNAALEPETETQSVGFPSETRRFQK